MTEGFMHGSNVPYSTVVDLAIVAGDSSGKRFLGTREDRTCRFCGRKDVETTFRSDAHVIAAAFGNRSLFSYEECDQCNATVGAPLENDLVSLFSVARATAILPARGGSRKVRRPNEKAYIQGQPEHNQLYIHHPSEDESVHVADDGEGTLSLRVKVPTYRPVNVARALARMAYFVLDRNEPGMDWLLSWIRREVDWFPVHVATVHFPRIRTRVARLMVHRYMKIPGRSILRVGFWYSSYQTVMAIPMDAQPLPDGLLLVDYTPPPGREHLAAYMAELPQNTSVMTITDNEAEREGKFILPSATTPGPRARQVNLPDPFAREIRDFRTWIAHQPQGDLRLQKWNQRHAANREAALAEATTWQYLCNQHLRVEHADDPSMGGPDFRCFRDGDRFYVEVTTLQIDTVTRHSGISMEPGAGGYSFLTRAIWNECKDKARQLAELDAPALLAINTFHGFGAMICFDEIGTSFVLTGETQMTWTLDVRTGRTSPTQNTTDLKSSAFLAPVPAGPYIEHKRTPISGVLLCAAGMPSRRTLGAMHPAPNHAFDPSWLPAAHFCRLKPGYQNGELHVEWVSSPDTPERL